MSLLNQQKYLIPLIVTLILTAYQLVRVIAFVNVYGGIEHDSGWFLGVSRSLAEQGTYTSMVSMIVDPALSGGTFPDEFYQNFNIQAADGRIWFFTASTTGPASVGLNALVLKLFGTSFWTLRAGPLIFYMLFLLIVAYTLYQLAGWEAILLFHLFLFCYPRLSIFLSYEAIGEVPAIVFLIWAYLVLAAAIQIENHRLRYFFAAGLIAGLAVNTKLLALLSVSGMLAWLGWLWLFRQKRVKLWELIGLGTGVVLVQVVWELIHLVILTWLTNFALYLRHAQERFDILISGGSGLGEQPHTGVAFMWRKFFMLEEIAHPEHAVTIVIFACVLLGGAFLVWLWQRSHSYRQELAAFIWLGWLTNMAWFVFLAKTGWPRHYWSGLILAVMILCVLPIILIRLWRQTSVDWPDRAFARWVAAGLGILTLSLMSWGFVSQQHVWGFFLPDEIVPYWLEQRFKYIDNVGLPWILIPRADQSEVVDYINHMPAAANVYYPYGHKGAEIPPLTGRVNYPLKRRAYPGVTPHPADILLIPSFIVSSWTHDRVMRENLLNVVKRGCPQPVLENDNYMICLVKDLHLPE